MPFVEAKFPIPQMPTQALLNKHVSDAVLAVYNKVPWALRVHEPKIITTALPQVGEVHRQAGVDKRKKGLVSLRDRLFSILQPALIFR